MKNTLAIHLLFLFALLANISSAQYIHTFAGNGTTGFSGDGGQASAAQISQPTSLVRDRAGNIYVGGDNRVRKITPAGIITTIAGTGVPGFSGDGGPATAARFRTISGLAMDTSGNIYVSDYLNYRVRKINTSGIISTFAGKDSTGFSGDGGAATDAKLSIPQGVAVDNRGNVYIADKANDRVRKVNPSGIISTFAGGGSIYSPSTLVPATAAYLQYPAGITIDNWGNLFVGSINAGVLYRITQSDSMVIYAGWPTSYSYHVGVAATATALRWAVGSAIDRWGNFYIVEDENSMVRVVDTAGIINLFAGTPSGYGFNGDSIAATAAELNYPACILIDDSDHMYVADQGNNRIRVITLNRPPSFDQGTIAHWTTYMGYPAASVSNVLRITDRDTGQDERWLVLRGPTHGRLSGFISGSGGYYVVARSNGASVGPPSVAYTPTSGFSGLDSFRVSVSDGMRNDTILVVVHVVTNHAPAFIFGASAGATICESSSLHLDSMLAVYDMDTGQGLVWSLIGTAAHGSVTGFSLNDTSRGSTVPAGSLVYNPATGYTGRDSFRVRVFDGLVADTIKIYVFINPLPRAGVISGASTVCIGASITWVSTVTGGTWRSASTTLATITPAAGIITGTAVGIDTLYYTVSNSCGIASAFRLISVRTVPDPPDTIAGVPFMCLTGITTFGETTTGGVWSSSTPSIASVYSGTGDVFGISPGTAIITYSVSNICGSSAAYRTITVVGAPYPGVISGTGSVCLGAGTLLSESVSGGRWFVDSPSIAVVDSISGRLSSASVGTVFVHYRVTGVCGSDTASFAVAIDPPPHAGVVTGPDSVCQGSAITLASSVAGTYWVSSDVPVATVGATNGIVVGTFPGYVTIFNIFRNSCGADTTSFPLFVKQLHPNPGTVNGSGALCVGDIHYLLIYGADYAGDWASSDPSVCTIETDGTLTAIAAGTCTVSYVLHNSCGGSAVATMPVIVYSTATCATSISSITEQLGEYAVYPNPNNGSFTLQYARMGASAITHYRILTLNGLVVQQGILAAAEDKASITLDKANPSGLYLLQIINDNVSKLIRVVVGE